MEYYLLKTDSRLTRLPQMSFPKKVLKAGKPEKNTKEKPSGMMYVKGIPGMETEYPDYFEKPYPMIADKYGIILKKYQGELYLYRIDLVEKEKGSQNQYFVMHPPVIDCADKNKSEFDKVGNIIRLVLDINKVGNAKIFSVKNFGKHVIVRLDVAESILKRNANGISFEPIEIGE